MKKYLVNVNNRDLGPYSETQVIDLIQRGYLPNFSRCQRMGENIWNSLKDMEEFSSEFSNKGSDWDEQTVLIKIKDWQKEQKIESVQDDKTIQIKNETLSERLSSDKTIISKKQIENLRTQKDKITKAVAAAEIKDLEIENTNDKTRILSLKGNSSEIEKAELEADKKWSEIEEIQKIKKKNNAKRGSITIIIVVLLAVFLFMPDQEDEQKNPSTTKEYILPVISFPQVYADPDTEKSAELLDMAKTINKTYSYDELLESTPLLLESYELNDGNKNALYALTLNYSLMIEHAQDKSDAANTVFKLLQLIGDGQEFYQIEVLTAKVYFLIFLEKFQAVKFLMDKYSAINNKVTPMLYAGYLKALIEVGDLVKARKVVDKLLPSENKAPKVYSAILDFYKNDNQDESYLSLIHI